MNIIIFGASGGTGRQLVEQALEQGHVVTAFVRNPNSIKFKSDRLVVVQGNVLNPAQVDAVMPGKNAVLYAVGVTKNSPKDVVSRGLKNVAESMQKHGVRRIVFESVYGAKETRKGLYSLFLWAVVKSNMEDKETSEEFLKQTDLDWVAVRPVYLTNGLKSGGYKTGNNLLIKGLRPTVSRADVADFMIKQLTNPAFVRQTPTISD